MGPQEVLADVRERSQARSHDAFSKHSYAAANVCAERLVCCRFCLFRRNGTVPPFGGSRIVYLALRCIACCGNSLGGRDAAQLRRLTYPLTSSHDSPFPLFCQWLSGVGETGEDMWLQSDWKSAFEALVSAWLFLCDTSLMPGRSARMGGAQHGSFAC